jgi:glycolate oxidase
MSATYARATVALKRRLGTRVVRTDDGALFRASFDSSKVAFPVEAAVHPRKESDIGTVLALANKHRVPVTVRGGGTSLTGSASPLRGGWVLDLSALRRIQIDVEAGLAIVQSGAIVGDIQRAAAAAAWFYPPDPSSKEYSTIGGNIACNAGGMHGGKYGVTRDYVLSLSGFLPTGEPVTWGGRFKKWSAGFNLRDLWIGSEGCLGVVTGAVLKLIPAPAHRWTLLASFESGVAAMKAARSLVASRAQPAILEFLDSASVECTERATGQAVFPGQSGRPVLLVELAGSAAEVREGKKTVTTWATAHAKVFRAARSRDEAEALWAVRRKCSPAMFAMGDRKLNEDIVIPLRSYERFLRMLEGLKRRHRLPMPTFGHVADGNLHVNIMYHEANARECRAAVAAVHDLMRGVKRLGGAISGEHGVGLAKTPFLSLEHSPAAIRAMRSVKAALDPNGILNPGKIFEEFRMWEHKRLKIDLPWDHK